MSDINSTALIERKSYEESEFMKLLHPDDGDVSSMMYSEIRKTPWMSYQHAEIHSKDDGKSSCEYHPSMMMHYLYYVHLRASIPEIMVREKVRDRVQICLPHNIMHNLIVKNEIQYEIASSKDVITGPSFPGKWLDVNSQYYMSSGTGHPETYQSMIGNTPVLTDWDTFIPAHEIGCPQPHYFEKSIRSAMPLYACKKSPPRFHYTFRLKILDLLRMRIWKKADPTVEGSKDCWKYISDAKMKASMLEKIDDRSKLSFPRMYGCYGMMSEPEHLWKMKNKQVHSILATTVAEKTVSNPTPAGSTASIPIDMDTPVRAIYLIAQHEKAVEINNLSNYTTDPYDRLNGFSPIESIVHKYSSKEVANLDEYALSKMQPWYHSKSCPLEAGYVMFSKGLHPHLIRPDVGLVYDKKLGGILDVKLFAPDRSVQWVATEVEDVDTLLAAATQHSSSKEEKINDRYHVYAYLLSGYIIDYVPDSPVSVNDGSRGALYHH